jgi:hypothetical protein
MVGSRLLYVSPGAGSSPGRVVIAAAEEEEVQAKWYQ